MRNRYRSCPCYLSYPSPSFYFTSQHLSLRLLWYPMFVYYLFPPSKTAVLYRRDFAIQGTLGTVGRHLGEVLVASIIGLRPGMLLNILQCKEQSHSKELSDPKMSTVVADLKRTECFVSRSVTSQMLTNSAVFVQNSEQQLLSLLS